MYERNAIVLERFFNQMFGYNMKNNLKTNFQDYCELIKIIEEFKTISDEGETVAQEYDKIANEIRQIQKYQETLEAKNKKNQDERLNIFRNIDENPELMQKKLENINKNIQSINDEIDENSKNYVDIIAEFNEKTSVRTTCERNSRRIENSYNQKLNSTLDNFQDIGINYVKKAKQFLEEDTSSIEEELISKIEKNGEKEKIPFDKNVVAKAITLSIDIQKRETDILAGIYDKTNRLFVEIKNNNVKVEKHKKTINDSKCKLEFINSIKEYLVQFLDNERITAVNGETEHTKLMKEACKNLEEDLVQINNLYTLLLKETTKKVTKKSYNELYNVDYLEKLENKANQYEEELKKLNLPVTVINPNYWRIEGMKKIYDVFYNCVTEVYGKDLSEYFPNEVETIDFNKGEVEEEPYEEPTLEVKQEESKAKHKQKQNSKKDNTTKSEIDRKIDMILGFDENGELSDIDEDDWDEDDFDDEETDIDDEEIDLEEDEEDDDNWDDEEDDFDIFGDEEENDNIAEDEEEDDWDDEDDFDENTSNQDDFDDEELEEEIEEEIEEKQEQKNKKKTKKDKKIEDVSLDIWGNKIKNKKNTKQKKNKDNIDEDSWENEFVNIEKKDNTKKKKGFFEKFKK